MSTFTTTRWSLILRAKNAETQESGRALDELCGEYRPALHAYAGALAHAYGWPMSHHDAEDLVHDFFIQRLLKPDFYDRVERERGRFRTFLKHCFRNFFLNRLAQTRRRENRRANLENIESVPAPQEAEAGEAYDRAYATVVVTRALGELERDFARRGHGELFLALRPVLENERSVLSYQEIAARFGMTEAAVKMSALRLRQGYRDLVLRAVRETVEIPAHAGDEARYLHRLLAA